MRKKIGFVPSLLLGLALIAVLISLLIGVLILSPENSHALTGDNPAAVDNPAAGDNPASVHGPSTLKPHIILCASFPEYDWVRNILGENPAGFQVVLLNDSGVDMHSYQPSVVDMAKIQDCSLIVYTGGESEFWIKDALSSSPSANRKEISLMEIFCHDDKLVSRYSADSHDHDHDRDNGHDNDHGHDHSETDEHIWLSLKSVPAFVREISSAISQMDSRNEAYYAENTGKYIEKLTDLDKEYTAAVKGGSVNTILFADRYPFKYLLEDYGLEHLAAFSGCSAETEASFETILFLSEAVNELNLQSVAILKNSNADLARTVIENSDVPDAEILVWDSMQSVKSSHIAGGETYLSIMGKNLAALKSAIGCTAD